ncbi:MAG TPA: gliding motility-associated C-terminal domain-containing protein [Saprospiraceae bacterium]|nr:gliding motility-associated C-terminal domain-containing protein [Saprospiraceae bacterium]
MSSSNWPVKGIFLLALLAICSRLEASPLDTIPGHYFYRDTFCSNQIILINGQFYGPDMPSGTDTLHGAAANGGDSIIHVDLTFFSAQMALLDGSICKGDTIWVNNVAYHAGHYLGEEIIEDGALNGCDSIVHIDLEVIAGGEGMLADSLCPGDFVMINGVRYDRNNPGGMEILPGASFNGCDSVLMIDLHFREFCPSTAGFVYAPNAFRPGSSDARNNYFYLSTDAGIASIRRMVILDRWGDLMYSREDISPNIPEEGWDGKFRGDWAPNGVYGFRAEIIRADGQTLVKTGEVAILR